MKRSILAFFFVTMLLGVFTIQTQASLASCAGCTIITSVLEQITVSHPGTKVDDSLHLWCKSFSGTQTWLNDVCVSLFGVIVPAIQQDFDNNLTPDQTCRRLELCQDEDLKCTLWPIASPNSDAQSPQQKTFVEKQSVYTNVDLTELHHALEEEDNLFSYIFHSLTNWSKVDAIKPLEDYSYVKQYMAKNAHKNSTSGEVHKDKKDLLPHTGDDDGDGSSTFAQLRGFNWRGKDCDDTDASIYPGRSKANKDPNVDHDCNGISGVDQATGKSYEDLYCSDTENFEIIALGDSATASFSLNPAWLHGASIKEGTYDSLITNIMDEMDFPQCSLVTGFDKDQCPSLDTSYTQFTSIYDYARSRNACNHRQYRSISKNGARSDNFSPSSDDGLINSLVRDPTTDKKAAVFFSLIGNDVCGRSTPVETYRDAMVESLNYLDNILTPGSWVFVGGLVDGRMLYEVMFDKIHPLGTHYWAFYDYLNCFDANPCQNWLTSDKALRDATTEHARALSTTLRVIAQNFSFKNFKLRYLDYEGEVQNIMASLKAQGRDLSRLVEATDGFHPSSVISSLLAQGFIKQIESSANQGAEIFATNPHQSEIFKTFGPSLNGY